MPVYNSKLTDLIFPLGAALSFVSLMAQVNVEVPFHDLNIPITGQSLAVLLVGYILGRKIGPLAILIYLLLGILGAPVFANGASGFSVLLKGSGGFLYGFVFGAAVAGQFKQTEWGRNFIKALVVMGLGTIVILFFGILHLTYLYGFEKALEYGFYPFWRGAVVKVFLGAIILPFWHLLVAKWQESMEA